MASTFTDLGIEKMATGENAGTWGDKTNTNLDIVNTAISGYVEQAVTSGGTLALSITDGASTATAQNAVIKLTGTITGNSIVTVPDSVEKVYIVTNGTSGAYTVQFKTASGTGITFGVSEKTTKLLYSDGTNIVDAGFSGALDIEGRELVLDADGDTSLTADTDDQIDIKVAGTDQLTIKDGALSPVTTNDIDLGTASLEFKDAFFDGTVTSDAFAGPLTGNVTGNASGTAATVTGAAQTNITSLGTLTALTVDNMVHNGDTITMTPSASDTATMTAATNGAFSLVTVDAAAAAANIQITADGTVDIDSAGVLTLDSGAAINIEPAAGSAILLDGTISVDAGVVTGATSITSTAFVGNVSGTAATVTGAAQSNITSLGTLTTLTVDNVITNGATIGHTSDTDLITLADGVVTVAGEVSMTTLDIGGTNVTSDAGELNILDGVTSDAAELNLLDGATVVIPGKVEGTNFTDSLLIGHATTGTLSSADRNTGVGIEALDALTSGDDNVAIGYQAGTATTTGQRSVLIGAYAGMTGTNMQGCIYIGYEAGKLSTPSTGNNIGIGQGSLKEDTNGYYNVCVGQDSGREIKLGHRNVCLGSFSGDNITTGKGNVVIGAHIDPASATGDKQLIIGGNDGSTTTTWISGDSSGNLTFKRVDTGDDNPYVLTLQTGETDIAANDVLGSINFQAPDEGTGTDAILVAAGIDAVSEGDFAADNNATKLSFKTGASEAAAEKMSLSSAGLLTIADDLIVKNAGTIGTAADSDLLTMGNAILTVAGEISVTTLDIGGTNVTSTATELNQLDGVVAKTAGKESIWVPSNSMTPATTNGAARASVETTATRPDMQVLDFDKDADEYAQFSVAFPKQWNLGTVTFQVFWSGIAATTDVDWGVQAVAMNDNETIDVAFGTAVVVTDNAQGAVEELLVSAESGAITIAGTPADNDLTYFQIYRDVSGDAMAGDARLHGVKIFYTTDAANDA